MNIGQLFITYATIIVEFLFELYLLYFLITKRLNKKENFKMRFILSTVCLLVVAFLVSIFYYYFGNTVIGRVVVYTSLFLMSIVHLMVLYDAEISFGIQ